MAENKGSCGTGASGESNFKDTNGKIITCRAAVFWDKVNPAKIEMITVKVPDADEIRIKMLATGICYSDITMQRGVFGGPPIIAGHEGVGVVESVGAKVRDFKTGDHVIPLWSFQCKNCRLCKIGRRNFCETAMKFIEQPSRVSCKDQEIINGTGMGLFAEYVVVNQLAALKIKSVPEIENLCLYGCCMPTGYGAAVYTAKVYPGAVCVVWGLGAVGLATVLGCRDAGAARIIGINRSKEKFALGKSFGCTECISPKDHDGPLSQVLKDMTNGVGPDFVFVCVGIKAIMEDAFEACRRSGGECIMLGLDPENNQISIAHVDTLFGKTVKGSFYGDCLKEHTEKMVNDYLKGKLPSDSLVSQKLPLDSINEGFQALKTGKAIRTVITF